MPAPSVAVKTTTCIPVMLVPEAGLWVLVGLAVQLSVAVAAAVYEAKVAVQFAPAATVVLAGQVMLGGVWSATETVNEQVAVLLAPSVAFKVTTWLPVMVVPETGVCVLVGLAVQLSVAVAAAV